METTLTLPKSTYSMEILTLATIGDIWVRRREQEFSVVCLAVTCLHAAALFATFWIPLFYVPESSGTRVTAFLVAMACAGDMKETYQIMTFLHHDKVPDPAVSEIYEEFWFRFFCYVFVIFPKIVMACTVVMAFNTDLMAILILLSHKILYITLSTFSWDLLIREYIKAKISVSNDNITVGFFSWIIIAAGAAFAYAQ